jgi:dephospho-CoA kinase
MAKIIGLTGGIGSGKTTVANFFAASGISVYIADLEAKKLMDSPEIKNAILAIFGSTVFDSNHLVRAKLAEIVFSNPEKLEKLNAIVHPAVRKHFKDWVLRHKNEDLLLYESAILFESGHYKDFDFIIVVTAPLESRISRVLERDNTSRDQIISRIKAQWSDEKRVSKSDFVIENTNLADTKSKVENILKILKIKQNEC